MSCFVAYNDKTIYELPNLECSDGQLVTIDDNTPIVVYNVINNKLIKSHNSVFIGSLSNEYYTFTSSDFLGFNTNFLIIPAVLLVLCFFAVIYKWIKGTKYV